MEIEVRFDTEIDQNKIIIYAKENSTKLQNMVNLINNLEIIGYKDNQKFILELNDIESFYTEESKVIARIGEEKFNIKKRIYELEDFLENSKFVRISNSEIVNINHIKKLECKKGTVCLYFKSNKITYVSRRYVKKIKEFILKEVEL